MKNTTLVTVSMIILMMLFASCKEDNSVKPSNQKKVTYNKSDSQNVISAKEKAFKRFEGLGLSNEMIEKITSHTTDQKIVRVIKNSRGLENLLQHPVIGTVTVINPNGKVLKNFSANLHYKNDIVIENSFKQITVFRSSFVSHEGNHLITSNRQSLENNYKNTETRNYDYETEYIEPSITDQTTRSISMGQNNANSNEIDGLKSRSENGLTTEEVFLSESLEKFEIIQNDINQTKSRIITLKAKLEDPIIFNDDELNAQFQNELSFQNELLNTQQEFIKELEKNLQMQKEISPNENLEKHTILQKNINQQMQLTMSTISILQSKLEGPISNNNNDLKTLFEKELKHHYELLDMQSELIKKLEENLQMQKEISPSEDLEKYKIHINGQVQLSMSIVNRLQAKLEDPTILNNNSRRTQIQDELSYYNDLLDTQRRLRRELNALRE